MSWYRTMDSAQNQVPARQYLHAMWDSRSGGMTREESIASANAFVRMSLMAARGAGAGSDKFHDRLGDATHVLQDATSPPHEGFQDWGGQQALGASGHGSAERTYPAAGTVARRQLEGVTRWAHDMATGKAPLPNAFFDPGTGNVNLPRQYQ
jgi:hypothetical protein